MKEKVHEHGTKAAKTPVMIYRAKIIDSISWIHPGQNDRQWSINDFWSCIIGNLHGNWLRPFRNAVLAGYIGK